MADKEKFYWLKLWRDFFRRTEIRLIEAMPNGKEYVLFYLKLLCEGLDNEGYLLVNKTIPYNEEMLSAITNTNIDIIRSAVKIFTSMGMMQLMDNGAYYLDEVKRMTGSAVNSDEANRQRRSREKKRMKEISAPDTDVTNCHGLVTNFVTKNNESIEIEIENRDRDRDINICPIPEQSDKSNQIEKKKSSTGKNKQDDAEQDALFDEAYDFYPRHESRKQARVYWSRIKPAPDKILVEKIKTVVQNKLDSGIWVRGQTKLIPLFGTFINGERWNDELVEQPSLFASNAIRTMPVEKNPRGYDPSNGFSEEELERRKERSRQLARERGEL